MSRYTITLGIPKPALPTGREEWQQSVQEMRAAVTRAQRDSNLVRQCNYRADLDGLNGTRAEDWCREWETKEPRFYVREHPLGEDVP